MKILRTLTVLMLLVSFLNADDHDFYIHGYVLLNGDPEFPLSEVSVYCKVTKGTLISTTNPIITDGFGAYSLFLIRPDSTEPTPTANYSLSYTREGFDIKSRIVKNANQNTEYIDSAFISKYNISIYSKYNITSNPIKNSIIIFTNPIESLYTDINGLASVQRFYNESITIKPYKYGYSFSPLYWYIDSISSNETRYFTCIDTMPPNASIIISDMYYKIKDTVKIILYDNSDTITYYQYNISYDNGNTWTILDEKSGKFYANNDTTLLEITPDSITSQALLKIIIKDIEKSCTIFSNNFKIIDNINPSVTLRSPVGGEIWRAGENHEILWNSDDNIGIDSAVILYSINNGLNWFFISNLNISPYLWAIPNTPSQNCLLKIIVFDQEKNNACDISNIFEIQESTNPTVTILTPIQDEKIKKGNPYTITWNANDNIGITKIIISNSFDGGNTWNLLANFNNNPGSWVWNVPSIEYNNCIIRISAHDASTNSDTAYSGIFEIRDLSAPLVNISNTINNTFCNSVITVRFSAEDDGTITSRVIELSSDSGKTYFKPGGTADSSSWNGAGIYSFRVPNVYSKNCFIRLKVYDSRANCGTTISNKFEITDYNPPIVTITSPNILEAQQKYIIIWNNSDNIEIDYSILYLSVDSGITFNLLVTIKPDTNKFHWTVPQIQKKGCYLKIETFDIAGNKAEAQTTMFTISSPVNIKNNNKIPKKFGVQILNKSFIICMEKTAPISISIITLNGRTIFYKSEMLSAGYHIIPKNYAQGMYILRVKRSDKTITKKVF